MPLHSKGYMALIKTTNQNKHEIKIKTNIFARETTVPCKKCTSKKRHQVSQLVFMEKSQNFFYTGLALDGRQAERVLLVVMSSLNCHFINRKSPNKIFLFSFAKVFFKYFGNINGHKWRKFTVQTIYKSMFSSNVAV